ncbi:hypothetical protein LEP1GSC133_4603 [Leptospira borgpetersenii serovar Pomona str. 200901868]|uniref:Uncharacterized protein n=1 Tax=Leptospira borgpetersenii serovar Pomona str. 200901868 TaxID=1192866 RepID=M6W1T3_LEPBO|nr:hypothetical protein LEP1GSC133_4603 [Leptospira borgpetersenii serovar Pomona str. 200901868]
MYDSYELLYSASQKPNLLWSERSSCKVLSQFWDRTLYS